MQQNQGLSLTCVASVSHKAASARGGRTPTPPMGVPRDVSPPHPHDQPQQIWKTSNANGYSRNNM